MIPKPHPAVNDEINKIEKRKEPWAPKRTRMGQEQARPTLEPKRTHLLAVVKGIFDACDFLGGLMSLPANDHAVH